MKVYSVPEEVHVPDFGEAFVDGKYDPKLDNEIHEAFFARLEAWCRGNGYTSALTGKIWRTPRGDGAAQYMVAQRPKGSPRMILIHLPIHDAWHADPVLLRGLRAEDVKADCTAKPLFGETR